MDTPDIATLGIRILLDGGEKTAADLAKVGTVGEQTANRVATAFQSAGATAQRAMQQQAAETQRILTAQKSTAVAAARETATAAMKAIEQVFDAEQARIREGIARGFLSKEQAHEAGRQNAIAYNQGVVQQLDTLGRAGLSSSNSKTYIELANAIKTVQAPLKDLEGQGVRTGVSLNTVRASFTSLLAASLQTAPGVAQLGSSVAALSLGTLTTIGVMAGLAAVSYGWQKWTEDARKAREEQDKLTDSLRKWYEEQRNGEAGARQLQVQATATRVAENESRLTLLRGRLDNPATRSESVVAAIEKEIADVEAALRRDRAAIAAGNADIAKTIAEGDVQKRNAEASNLASLISSHQATEAERARALRVLQEQQALLVAYSKPPAGASDAIRQFFLEQRAAIAQSAKALQEALIGKADQTVASAPSYDNQKVLDALSKQLDALRAVNTEGNKEIQRAKDQAAVLGTEGLARDLLVNKLHAEEEALQARAQYSGVVLSQRLADIAAEKAENDERAITKQRLDDIRTAQKLVTDAVADANVVAARNGKITHDALKEGFDLYKQSEKDASSLASTIQNDLTRSVVQFATSGSQSFTSFVHVVEAGAVRMLSAIDQSLSRQQELLAEANRKNQSADAAAISERIARLKQFQEAVGAISAGIAGGLAGYSIGQQIGAAGGSQGGGLIAGAATGALAGSAFGPFGAAIGGLAGAAGGLLGAAEAQKEAIRQFKEAIKEFQNSSQKYILASQGSTVGAQIIDVRAQGEALKKNADLLAAALHLAGSGLLGSPSADAKSADYTSQAAELQKAIDAALKRIEKDFFGSITEQLNALNGPAGEYANRLAAIDAAYQQNIANVNALAQTLHYSAEQTAAATAQVEALAAAQKAAAKAAYEEGQRREQEDFDTRRLSATGASDKTVNDAQFAIGQRRELADFITKYGDNAKDGTHSPEVQQLLDLQALERKRREDDFKAAQVAAQEDYHVRELAASGHAAEAEALRLQLAQQREYQDAVKAGLDDATLAALALAQAAEGAAAAAKQAQDAQRALDDLQVRALSAQGDTSGADALRFQLQQQRELEDAKAAGRSQDYLDKLVAVLDLEKRAREQSASQAPAGALPTSGNEAAIYAAKALTEVTGNRMADYLASILIVEKEQLKFWHSLGGQPLPSLSLPPSTFFQGTQAARAPTAPATATTQVVRDGATYNISVRVVAPESGDATAFGRTIAKAVAAEVDEVLADKLRDSQYRAGDPSRTGF